ncbi:hypothetical protein FHS83_001659 [Rhizomicrobium palustre]|jgi:hypothetical protein|uniref:PAS domain-containing protein n=1 Tax=Rhizomicrobium palustre TaxID=189966 RepID=A0A846MZ19_9PROT|nr:PAS domain-containing protein [Rhizomicrobium palustre]NIK88341.1 hypothetical protein [Rhizomicrobium palustre]
MEKASKILLEYWRSLCRVGTIPSRDAIEPKALKSILPVVFLLDVQGEVGITYSLAGTMLCERYGRELRGTAFTDRFDDQSRPNVLALLRRCQEIGSALYLHTRAEHSILGFAPLETIIAPLTFRDQGPVRFIGATHFTNPQRRSYSGHILSQRLIHGTDIPAHPPQPIAQPMGMRIAPH